MAVWEHWVGGLRLRLHDTERGAEGWSEGRAAGIAEYKEHRREKGMAGWGSGTEC